MYGGIVYNFERVLEGKIFVKFWLQKEWAGGAQYGELDYLNAEYLATIAWVASLQCRVGTEKRKIDESQRSSPMAMFWSHHRTCNPADNADGSSYNPARMAVQTFLDDVERRCLTIQFDVLYGDADGTCVHQAVTKHDSLSENPVLEEEMTDAYTQARADLAKDSADQQMGDLWGALLLLHFRELSKKKPAYAIVARANFSEDTDEAGVILYLITVKLNEGSGRCEQVLTPFPGRKGANEGAQVHGRAMGGPLACCLCVEHSKRLSFVSAHARAQLSGSSSSKAARSQCSASPRGRGKQSTTKWAQSERPGRFTSTWSQCRAGIAEQFCLRVRRRRQRRRGRW